MTGLRERKKQRTRDALIRAAHELFVDQGYEQTTVDQIATAVDVSQRTFFRYFAGKEETVFAVQEMIQERFVTGLAGRPEHEEPMAALRGALDDGWASIGEAVAEVVSLELHLRMWRVIETTPSLVEVHLRRAMEMEERLTLTIAAREGLDPDTDPRPRVLVAAFAAVMRTAMHRWGVDGEVTVESARDCVRCYLDELGPALLTGWRADGGGRAAGER
ncbi:TetR family transcriptional regulator [Streptomyces sp. TRM 70351]|uniref:TetR/AcrR family transcriptional regulator n=1 Tax=Streptomyces sp. TRM 70351 TaxID=3116552 RepID=UPI002E7C51FD|nr:TetR family transcriptional regulator [Streptomyces sp. TRM 70351]MEE1928518.1 TetR family transcriptional regulator [Streptomyces sp. TRM 70351]